MSSCIGKIAILLLMLATACEDDAKKTNAPKPAQLEEPTENQVSKPRPTPTPAPIPSEGKSEDVKSEAPLGEKIYVERCSACHGIIAVSNKRGLVSGKILDPYLRTFPKHFGVQWPDEEEAIAIEAALAAEPTDAIMP